MKMNVTSQIVPGTSMDVLDRSRKIFALNYDQVIQVNQSHELSENSKFRIFSLIFPERWSFSVNDQEAIAKYQERSVEVNVPERSRTNFKLSRDEFQGP